MLVVQCWDDGVTTDVRLADIFRRHKAKATFNLNAGLHNAQRKPTWIFKETQVSRLGWDEVRNVYAGFTTANHTLTHPHLGQVPIDTARREIREGRERLQQYFGQSVLGFAYPHGSYNEAVMDLLREAGHVYARTTRRVEQPFPPEHAMAFHPCCHFLMSDFWERYEKARVGGVFHFWGHSYEIIGEPMWQDMENRVARIGADPGARWADVVDLFV